MSNVNENLGPEEEDVVNPEAKESEDDAPEEATPESEPSEPGQPADEMKIVIVMKADSIMLGVQSPDCDPVYTTAKGDLEAALQMVPELVTEAIQKWAANPRYPKAVMPEPPPRPEPAAARPAAPKAQPSFF